MPTILTFNTSKVTFQIIIVMEEAIAAPTAPKRGISIKLSRSEIITAMSIAFAVRFWWPVKFNT